MSCRSVNGLSKIAICIGNPICMDQYTSIEEKAVFTRVMVEISADEPLPNSITIRCKGISFEQPVYYRWKLVACLHCKTFTHENRSCDLQQNLIVNQQQHDRVWAQKKGKNCAQDSKSYNRDSTTKVSDDGCETKKNKKQK